MKNKLNLESKDIIDNNIELISQLFPHCITEQEGKKVVDFNKLKDEFTNDIVDETKEKYELNWPGKRAAINEVRIKTNKTLLPLEEKSVNFEDTNNVYIEGDNLEVLKLLQESYLNKIKCIYIDPPYNTGKDFIYKDDFKQSVENELFDSGQVDEEGNKFVQNTETNGRYHSDWLSMMYPRLKLARNLLKEDGVIYISIDDNEYDNLKKICDEIFLETNYLNTISLKTKTGSGASGGGEDRRLKKNIEYILIYQKTNKFQFDMNSIESGQNIEQVLHDYRTQGVSWKYTSVLISEGHKEQVATTLDGAGDEIKVFKHSNQKYKSISQLMKEEMLSENDVYLKYFDKIHMTAMPQSSIRPRVIKALEKENIEMDKESLFSIEYVPKSGRNKGTVYRQLYKGEKLRLFAWFNDVSYVHDNIVYKTEKLGTLWDKVNFNNLTKEGRVPYPNGKKPIKLISDLINLSGSQNDYILDFFSGSGTTAHAVLENNKYTNKTNRFILVQLNEKVMDTHQFDFLKNLNDPTIPDIAQERIKRSIYDLSEETGADIDYGFRVFKLSDSILKANEVLPSDLQQDLLSESDSKYVDGISKQDIVTSVILDLGLMLDSRIKELDNDNFIVEEDLLFISLSEEFDNSVLDSIRDIMPDQVVLDEKTFAGNDALMTNVIQQINEINSDITINIL